MVIFVKNKEKKPHDTNEHKVTDEKKTKIGKEENWSVCLLKMIKKKRKGILRSLQMTMIFNLIECTNTYTDQQDNRFEIRE